MDKTWVHDWRPGVVMRYILALGHSAAIHCHHISKVWAIVSRFLQVQMFITQIFLTAFHCHFSAQIRDLSVLVVLTKIFRINMYYECQVGLQQCVQRWKFIA
jgi:hypothetical protein